MSISSKNANKSRSCVSKANTAPSKPTSSLSHCISPLTATLQRQARQAELSKVCSGIDSDSSGRQRRCSDRPLRLLEKLPNISNGSSSSPSQGGYSEWSSPESMDISFLPDVHFRATDMTKVYFTQAVSLFLGHSSHELRQPPAAKACTRSLLFRRFWRARCAI